MKRKVYPIIICCFLILSAPLRSTGLDSSHMEAEPTCPEGPSIESGYCDRVLSGYGMPSYSDYSFIAEEVDFQVNLSVFNSSFDENFGLRLLSLAIYGPFQRCEDLCNYKQKWLKEESFQWLQITEPYGANIGQFSFNSFDLPGYPFQPGSLFIVLVMAENTSPNSPIHLDYCFSLASTSCCWNDILESQNTPSLCESFYHLNNGNNQTIILPVYQTGINEIWLGYTTSAGTQLPTSVLNLAYDISPIENGCQLANNDNKLQVERYGPFLSCDNHCEAINLNPNPETTILVNTNIQGIFQIGAFNQNHETTEALWLFRLVFDASCAPCGFRLIYDLAGSVNGFSTSTNHQAPCPNCLPVHGLLNGKKYVVTAWVNDPDLALSAPSILDAEVRVVFNSGSGPSFSAYPFGPIIDGWQQIECVFETPSSFTDFNIELNSLNGVIYFDDVRMFPYDGSMKCYVYDPENLRFVAELDERHFATFYEYDEEGRLTRIKKETERGIMTIQESKTSTVKRPNE